MRNALSLLMVLAIAVPVATLAGCDRTVSENTKTSSDTAGNVKQETKTVTQDSGGGITVTKDKTEKSVDTH